MQPMAAGVRRSLIPARQSATGAHVSAHWPRDQPLATLSPDDVTPPLQRREFGAEGIRQSTANDSNGTPAEVRAGTVCTYSEHATVPWADGHGLAPLCAHCAIARLCRRDDTTPMLCKACQQSCVGECAIGMFWPTRCEQGIRYTPAAVALKRHAAVGMSRMFGIPTGAGGQTAGQRHASVAAAAGGAGGTGCADAVDRDPGDGEARVRAAGCAAQAHRSVRHAT